MKRKKILFVCTATPAAVRWPKPYCAAKIKKQKIKWWDVSSCGIFAEVGGSVSPLSMQALEEAGFTLAKFAPKQLSQSAIDKSYAVICMTEKQKQIIEGCGKVFCIKELCGFDVPDPYGQDITVYRATRDMLARACDIIIEKIILAENGG